MTVAEKILQAKTDYNEVYEAGYEKGVASVKPILYGAYLLAEKPNYQGVNEAIVLDGISGSVRGRFEYDDKSAATLLNSVRTMEAHTQQFRITSTNDAGDFIATTFGQSAWYGRNGNYTNLAYRVIEFKKPVEVSQEFYNIFMSLVDCSIQTPFDIGLYIGVSMA